jgi:uncharacterized protein YjbJ (UPF0337 family)
MNWDEIKGNWKQLKGAVKEKWGKLTDNDLDKVAGDREKLAGDRKNAMAFRSNLRSYSVTNGAPSRNASSKGKTNKVKSESRIDRKFKTQTESATWPTQQYSVSTQTNVARREVSTP